MKKVFLKLYQQKRPSLYHVGICRLKVWLFMAFFFFAIFLAKKHLWVADNGRNNGMWTKYLLKNSNVEDSRNSLCFDFGIARQRKIE